MKQTAELRGRRTGRSTRVLLWLQAEGKPHLVRDIIQAVEPTCTSNLMSGTLSTLERNKKVTRSRIDGRCAYLITPDALVNKRTGRRIDDPQGARVTKPVGPSRQAKSMHSATLVTRPINTQRLSVANAHGGAYLAAKQLESRQIACDIAAFEKSGGKIQRLEMHECSRPLNGDYRDPRTVASSLRGGKAARNLRKHSPSPAVDDFDDADE